jgi:hypothetical protein
VVEAAGGEPIEPESDQLGEVLGSLTDAGLSRPERRRQLLRLSGVLAERARTAGAGAVMSGRWVAGLLLEAAPHIPVRDLETLREHHHGLTGEALADAMVKNAANVTTAVGAAVGTVATAQWIVAPVLIAVPLEVLVETLVVAVVEVKLLAELHAVHGVSVPGTPAQRALAYVGVWVRRRGVNPLQPWTISAAMAAAGRASLSRRMLGRFARNLGTLVPLMVGAVYGARSNRRQTRELAAAVRADLLVARHEAVTAAGAQSR